MSKVESLNTKKFQDKISSGLSLVKFTSQYCGPCKSYSPIFDSFAEQNKDIKCYTVDALEEHEISIKLDIKSVPVTILFKDGKEVKRVNGKQSLDQLSQLIKE